MERIVESKKEGIKVKGRDEILEISKKSFGTRDLHRSRRYCNSSQIPMTLLRKFRNFVMLEND